MTVQVRIGGWDELGEPALRIRHAVFVVEQSVPPELEHDAEDLQCRHALATVDGLPVGTGRLTGDAHIGRMALLRDYRGRGIGSRLLRALIEEARARGDREVVLNAQIQAIPFYQRLGFVAEGSVFDDAGIPHRRMRYRLPQAKV